MDISACNWQLRKCITYMTLTILSYWIKWVCWRNGWDVQDIYFFFFFSIVICNKGNQSIFLTNCKWFSIKTIFMIFCWYIFGNFLTKISYMLWLSFINEQLEHPEVRFPDRQEQYYFRLHLFQWWLCQLGYMNNILSHQFSNNM